jgi:hypothetical protein
MYRIAGESKLWAGGIETCGREAGQANPNLSSSNKTLPKKTIPNDCHYLVSLNCNHYAPSARDYPTTTAKYGYKERR